MDMKADILRSAMASFRIEKLVISPEQAAVALKKAEVMSGKLSR